MTNSDKFKQVFGLYATELWAMTETEFLTWLNADAQPERRDCGWTGIDDDYPVSIREVIDITAETGALTTQSRVMKLKPYKQPERKTDQIIARIKQESIKRNKEYMKHGDRYMLGFVDGMRLARSIVDGSIDEPHYFIPSKDGGGA